MNEGQARPLDSPQETSVEGEIDEIEALAPSPAAREAGTAEHDCLDLMLPHELPTRLDLSTAESEALRPLLEGVLDALSLDHPKRLAKLDELLSHLAPSRSAKLEARHAGIPLTSEQTQDYDRYFRVRRVSSENPAAALVRSLVQTVRAVTELYGQSHSLSATARQEQDRGFAEHARLLARSFGLDSVK
ncbi:hypothetical protein [Fulvimarina sp. MAC8]|uniref:hypothetical protein n=1 Tax=Fulvimarina sp. MAC8 TaxID=3162874 RepID=UPI0032F09939